MMREVFDFCFIWATGIWGGSGKLKAYVNIIYKIKKSELNAKTRDLNLPYTSIIAIITLYLSINRNHLQRRLLGEHQLFFIAALIRYIMR